MEMRAWDQFCKQESPEIEKYRQKQELLSIQFVKNNTQKKKTCTPILLHSRGDFHDTGKLNSKLGWGLNSNFERCSVKKLSHVKTNIAGF